VKTVVSKGEFAKRKQRGPSAVSNWIAAGKITAAALIGTGNAAKIWVEQAERDLAASLDPSQQVIQAAPILAQAQAPLPDLPLVPGDAPPAAPAATRPTPPATDRELDLARRTKADADRAELDLEAARRKMAIDEGRYVVAEDAARAWGKELARFIADTETFLSSTLARELAASHGLDWKALSVEIREKFRGFRAETSEEARARREAPAAEEQAEADAQG
jgi:hypothetical protein